MRLLDKYLLKNFLTPFLLCFFGFLAIWLVFDLADNASDFIEGKAGVSFVVQFYLTQLPQIIMISLPFGLLLALLYSLSRMSRSNEIIAMLTAGQSLVRLVIPLLVCGLLLTGVSAVLNYALVPHAEMHRKQAKIDIGKKREKHAYVRAHLFRNRADKRTWFIEQMPAKVNDVSRLVGIEITQQDAKGDIVTKWYAREARYNDETKTWLLRDGRTVVYNEKGDVTSGTSWDKLELANFRETPRRIASSNFQAQDLSVPELKEYLEFNADFPDPELAPFRTHLQHRWALPWACTVVVLLAAPLGVVYSRRGGLAGMAGAIFLFVAYTFFNDFMLALGKGSRVSPFVAAWLPTILFGILGGYLLYMKAGNRELPKLFRFE